MATWAVSVTAVTDSALLGGTVRQSARPSGASRSTRSRVLYLSWDGVLDPLGQSQVVPYVKGLARCGHTIQLVSLEKQNRESSARQQMSRGLASEGVGWSNVRYRPGGALAGGWNLLRYSLVVLGSALRLRPELVHARGYLAAAVGVLAAAATGAALIFDMRGFWADERVDGGLWRRRSWRYRVGKRLERTLLRRAAAVVLLTRRGLRELPRVARSERLPSIRVVIPTAVDCAHFRRGPCEIDDLRSEAPDHPCLVYSGSLGTWYLHQEMARFVSAVRELTDARFLGLLNTGSDEMLASLRLAGVPSSRITLARATYDELPAWLRCATAGLAFIRPSPSKAASYPTKIGEYLASGLPVVVVAGVGDLDEFIETDRVGVSVQGTSDDALRAGAAKLLALLRDQGLGDRCRQTAERALSLSSAVANYATLYERVRLR